MGYSSVDPLKDPLGYERKFGHHNSLDEPTQTTDDNALANRFVGASWVISVALLHSRFIGFDHRSRRHAGARASLVILSSVRSGVDSLRAARVLRGRGVARHPCGAQIGQ